MVIVRCVLGAGGRGDGGLGRAGINKEKFATQ